MKKYFTVLILFWMTACTPHKTLYQHSFQTPERLGETILKAISENDSSRLAKVLMTETEYKQIFYKSLPDSIQQAMPVDLAWGFVEQDSRKAIRRYLADYGGQHIRLQKVFFRFEPHRYENLVVHRGMVMEVLLPNGETESWRLVNVVVEQNGYFKVVAFND
ncbi:MAG: hypothetical protein N2450_00405 [bacterium]|nr:hypothetical protein [bacterium]